MNINLYDIYRVVAFELRHPELFVNAIRETGENQLSVLDQMDAFNNCLSMGMIGNSQLPYPLLDLIHNELVSGTRSRDTIKMLEELDDETDGDVKICKCEKCESGEYSYDLSDSECESSSESEYETSSEDGNEIRSDDESEEKEE